jgi:hypothetical protein
MPGNLPVMRLALPASLCDAKADEFDWTPAGHRALGPCCREPGEVTSSTTMWTVKPWASMMASVQSSRILVAAAGMRCSIACRGVSTPWLQPERGGKSIGGRT